MDDEQEERAAWAAGAGFRPDPTIFGDLIFIDGIPPVALSVDSSSGDGTFGIGSVINITATFSEPVTGSIDVTLNTGSALWTRSKTDVTEEQYADFYKHLTHDWEAPLAHTHFKVEGTHELTSSTRSPP